MRIPKQILGYTLTPAERVAFIKNNLSSNLVDYRIRKGWERERWFEPKSEINALRNIMTEERQKLMDELEISDDTVRKRMRRGWTFDEATTTPLLWVEEKMPKQEVIEVIGRIKYLNSTKKYSRPIDQWTIPAPLLRRAKEYKIDIDKVKELPV